MDTTMAGTGAALDARSVDDDRAWARIGRIAAYFAGIGFLVVTVLYLLDVFDVLDPSPTYVQTAAGQLQDEAHFWAAVFQHQHRIVWDVVVRDVVGPASFIALIVVGLALRRLVTRDHPSRQLMVGFLTAGGIISAIGSLLYLGNVEYWRLTWGSVPAGAETSMVAVGRATTAIDNLTVWTDAFGYVVLALGVLCVGVVVGRENGMPKRLGTLAYVTSATLVALAVAAVLDTDTPHSLLSLAVGAVLAPWLCLWLGRVLGRPVAPPVR
jgi:hypothetical protein